MKHLTRKFKFELTGRELMDLANMMASCDNSQREFLNVKDRRIRKIFRKDFERRHKLWIKIVHMTD